MREVNRYEAKDGKLFETEAEAHKHEAMLDTVESLRRMVLPDKYDNCNFANGGGYIQLSAATVNRLTRGFQDAIATFEPSLKERALRDPKGIIGRFLDDGRSPLYRKWVLSTDR